MNRSNDGKDLCSYIHRICLQTKLEGFDYCIRHILVDKNAPFKQCTFSHPITNKRCPNAARKSDRASQVLCPWHIKKMFLKQKHQQLHQQLQQNIEEAKAKREGLKGLLLQLEHYSYTQDPTRKRVNINWVKQDDDNSITASDYLRNKISEAAIESLDQESDEELSNPMLEDVLRPDLIDSDSENFDSDQDDPLKHAGVYTAEEVSLILRDKMLKLQSLYIGQFKHLQYLLREKYKRYLQSLQNEKEVQAMMEENGEFDVSDSGYSEEDVYRLRALVKYHRYRGPEALLKDKAREKRRALLEGENFKPKIYARCIFNKDAPCQNQALPLSHYCKSHILFDSNQVLFRPCAAGEPPCLNPVISIRRHHTCIIHSDLKQHNSEIDKLLQEFHQENHEKQSSPQTSLSVSQEIVSCPEPQTSEITFIEIPTPTPPPPPPPLITFNQFDTPVFSSQDNFKQTIQTDLNTESQESMSCQTSENLITPNLLQPSNQDPQPEQMDTSLDQTPELSTLPSLETTDRDFFPLETFTDANFPSTINPDPNTNPNFNGTQI